MAPGSEGGHAVADVLLGNVNPGGKLPITWPRTAGQEPLYYNHNLTQRPESAPGFTSRYWDAASTPLYRFGFGLSYTKFSYNNLRLADHKIAENGSTEISVEVTNVGSVRGDAVPQLYIHQVAGDASRPVRQLEGFQRISFAPGETKTVVFPIRTTELSYWNPQSKQWTVDPGQFDLWIGDDSGATLTTRLTVNRQ